MKVTNRNETFHVDYVKYLLEITDTRKNVYNGTLFEECALLCLRMTDCQIFEYVSYSHDMNKNICNTY